MLYVEYISWRAEGKEGGGQRGLPFMASYLSFHVETPNKWRE